MKIILDLDWVKKKEDQDKIKIEFLRGLEKTQNVTQALEYIDGVEKIIKDNNDVKDI